jgi:hypothetical protein
MSDLCVIKQLDGYAAMFLRFAGPDNFVIEVNGAERTVSREFWRALPHRDASKVERTFESNVPYLKNNRSP